MQKKYSISIEKLKEHSFVIQGPWSIQKKFREIFKTDFQGPVILVPGNKHYSWMKGASFLGLGLSSFWSVELDENGKLSLSDLKKKIQKARTEDRPILMVVSVVGTTELGEIDPIHEVQNCIDSLKKDGVFLWHHIDAAFGGFFATLMESESTLLTENNKMALKAMARASSITIDPHKLGYVPYSCGAILVRDPQHYTVSSFQAPYLSSIQGQQASWSTTLEGSRPASGATAMWLSAQCIGLNEKGYGQILLKGLEARDRLLQLLKKQVPGCYIASPSDTNILCFCVAQKGEALTQTNQRTLSLYKHIHNGQTFSVSKTSLHFDNYSAYLKEYIQKWRGSIDTDHLILIRTVLMNPFILSKETTTDYLYELTQEIKNFILKYNSTLES